MVVWENRLELFLLEVEEEREQILTLFKLGVGIAVFVLLAVMALSALIIVACWKWSPIGALAILVALYGGIAAYCFAQLVRLRKNWQTFSATLDEMRKDRECLDRLANLPQREKKDSPGGKPFKP